MALRDVGAARDHHSSLRVKAGLNRRQVGTLSQGYRETKQPFSLKLTTADILEFQSCVTLMSFDCDRQLEY